ncbi:MAG: hypothetical protein BMS9Abin37_2915 [Acidobacteriota bacterium]|nr:MAG: hypothetical protein BMS9Abin37_2915 [Acidobacteriota bacterium]
MNLQATLGGRSAATGCFTAIFLALVWRAPGLEFYLSSPDHGYQLALGRQIFFGKFPYVDLFFHYGPLTAFTSAFAIWLSDSLVTETLVCALGYALALFLLHRMALFHIGPAYP